MLKLKIQANSTAGGWDLRPVETAQAEYDGTISVDLPAEWESGEYKALVIHPNQGNASLYYLDDALCAKVPQGRFGKRGYMTVAVIFDGEQQDTHTLAYSFPNGFYSGSHIDPSPEPTVYDELAAAYKEGVNEA